MLSMQNVVETALEEFDDMSVIKADEDIASLFTGTDESFVTQTAQLMRNGGFGHTQAVHQFANSNFSIKQSTDDENACRVAQCVEQVGEIGCDFGGDLIFCHD